MPKHPAQRFSAPASIQRGVPLKALMGQRLIALISESLETVVPDFDATRFQDRATTGLGAYELKDRALHIAHAMAAEMPSDFDALAPLLIQSLGLPLDTTEGYGLAPFFYLPHSQLIATYGTQYFNSAIQANYALTQRFTAEFSIRPLLIEHQAKCLKQLDKWTTDPNPHVRRLVSEGTRPLLPWAMRLHAFKKDPEHTLPLLQKLKNDPDLYVRRSVANHLGDIAKDHPDLIFDLCEQWLEESKAMDTPLAAKQCRWMIRHALRHPAKKGVARALSIRKSAADKQHR